VEKNDGKHLNLRQVLKQSKLCLAKLEIIIVFYGSTDGKRVYKQAKYINNVKQIDIEKIHIDKTQQELLNKEAQSMVDEYFTCIERATDNTLFIDAAQIYYGLIFHRVQLSLVTRAKLSKILAENAGAHYILIGKREADPFPTTDPLPLRNMNYYVTLSAWLRILVSDPGSSVEICETDSWIRQTVAHLIARWAFVLAYIHRLHSYRIVKINHSTSTSPTVTVLLRGKAHVNIAKNLLGKKSNVYILFDSRRVPLSHLKDGFPQITKTAKSKRLVVGSMARFCKHYHRYSKSALELKGTVRSHRLGDQSINWLLASASILYIRLHEISEVEEYITFEETNLFGSLFSRALVPTVLKSACIQHGFTVQYYYTMPLVANERWVWGEFFKEQYVLRDECPNRIKIYGSQLLNYSGRYEPIPKSKQLDILLAPSYEKDMHELEKWFVDILDLMSSLDVGKLVVSLHPNQRGRGQLCKCLERRGYTADFVSAIGRTIRHFDIVISGDTTVGFEAALLGKTVFYYNSRPKVFTYDYVHHPYIIKINKYDSFAKIYAVIDPTAMHKRYLDFVGLFAGIDGTIRR